MDPPAVEDVQSGKNGENRNIDIYIALLREQLQEERKVCEKSYSNMLNVFCQEIGQVHERLDTVETNHARLNNKVAEVEKNLREKVNDLEDQFNTNKKNLEQSLQDKEKKEREKEKMKRRRRKEKKLRRKNRSHGDDVPGSKSLSRELILLTEGSTCVQFIGKLVLASFPEGYFLEKKKRFLDAISEAQIDILFEIVSKKFKMIQRSNQPPKVLERADVKKVCQNRVTSFRSRNKKKMY